MANSSMRDTGRGPPEAAERLFGALYDLSRHRDSATLGQRIVAVVPRIVACDSAVFARIQPATRTFTFVAWPERSFESIDHSEVIALHLQDHPLIAHFAARRDARAWSLHDFVPESRFRRTPLYRKLYRPLGVEYQLAMLIPSVDRDQRVLALNRRDVPFSEDEKCTLELTWPHLAQAVRACRGGWRRPKIPEIDSLAGGRGVIVLNRTGKVELCTEQARIWLTRYCIENYSGREIRALPEPIEAWVANALTNRALQARGCDAIDVSTGGNTPESKPVYGRMYQVPFAERIRYEVGMPVMAVGAIQGHDHANTILAAGRADLAVMARPHLVNPYVTLTAAATYEYLNAPWPKQYLPAKPRARREE